MSHCISSEDVFVWSDSTWCYREEADQMNHMSDDYCILYVDSIEYLKFFEEVV